MTINNLRKQVNMFKAQAEATQKAWQETNKKLDEERGLRYAAEREVEQVRKQFADLKERLYKSEIANAKNEGYLERVREDDNVADPLIEIEDANGKRMVSKRFPTPIYNSLHDGFIDHNGKKQQHWVTY